jgi:Tfp pilus assembly protein PilX
MILKLQQALADQRGVAIVAVLILTLVFFALVTTLLFQSTTERLVVVNEMDHLKTLGFAEAGLDWATRRVLDSSGYNDLLDGPNAGSTTDDYLLGLRDLSLTATNQLHLANEDTKSAIVTRDFGDGSKTYEAFRVIDETDTRALVYVRIDDNYDDDPNNPGNNAPLSDTDNLITATAVAEYPIFVNGAGWEQANPDNRGRAVRRLRLTFSGGTAASPAVASDGDVVFSGGPKICGDCGSVHSNQDFSMGGEVCKDATASGSYSNGGTVHGTKGGGFPKIPVPDINPYDDLFVPTIETFDTSGDTTLPSGLRCPLGDASDPGANKYFAFVGDGDKGLVYKAYWDAGNTRWTWKQIENLEGANVVLDDCGRTSSDANYRAGAANSVNDGTSDSFYGWKGDKLEWDSCSSCGSSGEDKSWCAVAGNDFVKNGHHVYGGGWSNSPILPGGFDPEGTLDLPANKAIKSGGVKWDFASSRVYSPLYGAVLWVMGTTFISGNPGETGSVDFKCGTGAGCSSSNLPYGLWKVSMISVGDIHISGQANLGPANVDEDYWYLAISGRDIMLNGNPQEDSNACSGGTCSYSAPSDIAQMGGIYAAHEQIQISGNPNIFGFMIAEDAIDCSSVVTAPVEFNGDPNIFYDCNHPPNPWAVASSASIANWHELE